jgi:hypothetical protein
MTNHMKKHILFWYKTSTLTSFMLSTQNTSDTIASVAPCKAKIWNKQGTEHARNRLIWNIHSQLSTPSDVYHRIPNSILIP